jgi:hypothetical protein
MRTNLKPFSDTQTGRESGKIAFPNHAVHYSFTLLPTQSCKYARPRILTECVPSASPHLSAPKSASKPPPAINAFLTLSAVTKW